jgi:hypothetical protein
MQYVQYVQLTIGQAYSWQTNKPVF